MYAYMHLFILLAYLFAQLLFNSVCCSNDKFTFACVVTDECTIEMSTLIGQENYGSSSLRNQYILTHDGRVQLTSPAVKQHLSLSHFFRVIILVTQLLCICVFVMYWLPVSV